MRDKYHFTCLCTADNTYAIDTRECGIHRTVPETPPIASGSPVEGTANEPDEITPTRAARMYDTLFTAIYRHMATCRECDELGTGYKMCAEQSNLWKTLRRWGEHMEEEKPAC
jgi:hypothetical protein